MMLRMFLALVLTTICVQHVSAKTYECKAVDEISMLGISPRAAVSISADEEENECKFSVNGAKVGSPPQQQISEAFNRNLFEGRQLFSGQFDATGIAAMMLAAGPDDTTDAVSAILDASESEILTCISNLQARTPGSADGPSVNEFASGDGSGICAVVGSGGFEFGPITFRYDENDAIPILLLFLKRGTVTNLLAIPRPPQ